MKDKKMTRKDREKKEAYYQSGLSRCRTERKFKIKCLGMVLMLMFFSVTTFAATGVNYSKVEHKGAIAVAGATLATVPFLTATGEFKELEGEELTKFIEKATDAELTQYHAEKNKADKVRLEKMQTDAKATKEQLEELVETIKQSNFDFTNALKEQSRVSNANLTKLIESSRQISLKTASLQKIHKHLEGLDLNKRAKDKVGGMERIEIKAAEVMSIAGGSIVTADDYSINVNNYVDSEIGHTPKPKNFILALITVETQSGTEKIWWSERTNEEGNAQFIGEGDLKPLISAKYTTKSSDIKEVAERWKMTNRMIMHTNRVVGDFQEHANELIEQQIDTKVLQGDGIGDNLLGIFNQVSAFIAPTSLIGFYQNPNIWDVINAIIAQISLANFTATDIVLNTVQRAIMFGTKDTQDRYIMPPFMTPDGKQISGLAVTFTNKMPEGKIMVGDMKKFKAVFSEDIMFDSGLMDDDFATNHTSFKLEAYLGVYIKAPNIPSIVVDDIATVKTAIGTV